MPYADPEKQKQYQQEWNRRYYKKHRTQERSRIVNRKKEIANWFANYKKGLSCVYCGEQETACLDFHHTGVEKKDFNLALARSWGWGKARIENELKKCKVVCANCHRKVHAGILGSK